METGAGPSDAPKKEPSLAEVMITLKDVKEEVNGKLDAMRSKIKEQSQRCSIRHMDGNIKILIMGVSGMGKTALVNKLTDAGYKEGKGGTVYTTRKARKATCEVKSCHIMLEVVDTDDFTNWTEYRFNRPKRKELAKGRVVKWKKACDGDPDLIIHVINTEPYGVKNHKLWEAVLEQWGSEVTFPKTLLAVNLHQEELTPVDWKINDMMSETSKRDFVNMYEKCEKRHFTFKDLSQTTKEELLKAIIFPEGLANSLMETGAGPSDAPKGEPSLAEVVIMLKDVKEEVNGKLDAMEDEIKEHRKWCGQHRSIFDQGVLSASSLQHGPVLAAPPPPQRALIAEGEPSLAEVMIMLKDVKEEVNGKLDAMRIKIQEESQQCFISGESVKILIMGAGYGKTTLTNKLTESKFPIRSPEMNCALSSTTLNAKKASSRLADIALEVIDTEEFTFLDSYPKKKKEADQLKSAQKSVAAWKKVCDGNPDVIVNLVTPQQTAVERSYILWKAVSEAWGSEKPEEVMAVNLVCKIKDLGTAEKVAPDFEGDQKRFKEMHEAAKKRSFAFGDLNKMSRLDVLQAIKTAFKKGPSELPVLQIADQPTPPNAEKP